MVGYVTVYRYAKQTDAVAYKISQFFVYPQWQKRGLGYKFLRIIYKFQQKCKEI